MEFKHISTDGRNPHISFQRSTSGPYGRREITSGDIQYGVTTNDFLLGNSCHTCAQKPQSDNFTLPSAASNIESLLTSLCITPCDLRYVNALRHYLQTVAHCSPSRAHYRFCSDLLSLYYYYCTIWNNNKVTEISY